MGASTDTAPNKDPLTRDLVGRPGLNHGTLGIVKKVLTEISAFEREALSQTSSKFAGYESRGVAHCTEPNEIARRGLTIDEDVWMGLSISEEVGP
jgi:hypothetical protein